MAGIQTSLRKILSLDFTTAPTIEQLVNALQQAKRLTIVQETKWLNVLITTLLISFQIIYLVQEIIAIIKQLKPILNLITKAITAAGIPPYGVNGLGKAPSPGMIAEVISDIIEVLISTIKSIVNQIIDTIIATILDYEFTIDISSEGVPSAT